MGASGSFEFGASGYLQGRIDWFEGDYNIGENTSPVTAILYARRTNNYTTSGRSWSGWIEVDGQRVNISFSSSVSVSNNWVEMARISSKTIWHYDDGTRQININGSVTGPSGTALAGNTSSGSQNVTLITIPRASSVSATSGNVGETISIYINRASSSFRHTLIYSWGGLEGYIATQTADTVIPWTIPTSFYEKIPNAPSGWGRIICVTYNNGAEIGRSECTFAGYVSNSNPTITGNVIDNNPATVALTGNNQKMVKFMSNAYITATGEAKNSASIYWATVTCGDGKVVSTFPNIINNVESGIFNFLIQDSRGFQGNYQINREMIPYIKTAITEYSLERLSSTSNTLSLILQGQWFNGNFGATDNTLTLKYRYKEDGTEEFGDWITLNPIINENSFRFDANLEEEFDFQKAWNIEIQASDKLVENTIRRNVTAGIPLIDIWKDNVKINGNLFSKTKRIYTYIATRIENISPNNWNDSAFSVQTDELLKGKYIVIMNGSYVSSNAIFTQRLLIDGVEENGTRNSAISANMLYTSATSVTTIEFQNDGTHTLQPQIYSSDVISSGFDVQLRFIKIED